MWNLQIPKTFCRAILVALCIVVIVVVTLNIDRLNEWTRRVHSSPLQSSTQQSSRKLQQKPVMGVCDDSLKQRNRLSMMLNRARQDLTQQECNYKEKYSNETKERGSVSQSGGWCSKASELNSREHRTDKKLGSALSHFLKGKFVAGFGDGPGHYKKIHDELGLIAQYDAYDGSPFIEEITEGRVQYMDLSVPQYGRPLYDWIVCLEVAEHIPHKYQDIFVDNLARHAKTGIILSWARLGQGGLSHVNNQNPEVVVKIMKDVGFSLDESQSNALRNASAFGWLRNNIRVYLRDTDSFADPDQA